MNHVIEALLDIYKVSVRNGKQIVVVVCLMERQETKVTCACIRMVSCILDVVN